MANLAKDPEAGSGVHRGPLDDSRPSRPGRHRRQLPAEAEGVVEIITDRRGAAPSVSNLKAAGA